MELSSIVDRLDEELRTDEYADLDASANGLQVGPEVAEIERVAVAVDGVRETFEAAIEADADLLVVHHGLSWGGFDRVTGRTYDRIAPLIENNLALYVSHLPLDGHQELGNAAGVADLLGLEDRAPFGEHGPEHIGQRGTAAGSYTPMNSASASRRIWIPAASPSSTSRSGRTRSKTSRSLPAAGSTGSTRPSTWARTRW